MLLPNHQDSTVDGNGRFLTHVFIISISRSALFRFSSFLRSSGGSERIRSPWCSNTSQPVVQVTTSKWSEEEEEDGEPLAYVLHQNTARGAPVREHDLKPGRTERELKVAAAYQQLAPPR